MVVGPANTFSWLKKPPPLPFAAFHRPSWTLGLQHHLRLQPNTAVARGAEGVTFMASSCPSNWPFGGGLYSVMCMPGWIFRRRATSSATALFGPWPDSSMRLAEVSVIAVGGRLWLIVWHPSLHCLHYQERGIAFVIQYPPWVQPNIINSFAYLAAPGLRRGPRLLPFILLCSCV
jgi:hypothetical protein